MTNLTSLTGLSIIDLDVLDAALRTFMVSADKSIQHYMEVEDAEMLLITMKEKERANRLQRAVWKATDEAVNLLVDDVLDGVEELEYQQ
jgi:hypothetical protein